MLLCNAAVSGECYKVRLLLAQLGLQYEELEADVADRSDMIELLNETRSSAARPNPRLNDGRALA